MAKKGRRIFHVMIFLIASLLLVTGLGVTSQAQASSVVFDWQHGVLDSAAGTFTFDVLVGDIGGLGDLGGWQLDFDITRSTDPGKPFSFHCDPLGVVADPNYVFYGNSYDYQQVVTPPNPPSVGAYNFFGGDLTADGLGVKSPEGKLLARLILDEVKYCDWFLITINNGGVNSFFENEALDWEPLEGTYEVHVTPIPSAVLLLGSGLIGLVGIRRRRTRNG